MTNTEIRYLSKKGKLKKGTESGNPFFWGK
jgi:hypothetical protein